MLCLQIEVTQDKKIAKKICLDLGDNRLLSQTASRANMFNLKGWGACIPNGKNRWRSLSERESKLTVSPLLSAKSRKSIDRTRNFLKTCPKIANDLDRHM
jgi:hypothetical protein